MKGSSAAAAAGAAATSAKRRWKGLAVTVFALVFCSLLVPLSFLLGRFPSGYLADDRASTEPGFGSYGTEDGGREQNPTEGDGVRIEHLVEKFVPESPKAVVEGSMRDADGDQKASSQPIDDSPHITSSTKNATSSTSHPKPKDVISNSQLKDVLSHSTSKDVITQLKDAITHPKDPPTVQVPAPKSPSSVTKRDSGKTRKTGTTGDESERSCQIEFGSYCLWSTEHRELLKDSMVKRLKDQLFVIRAYYPSIAKLQGQEQLTREVKQQIQEHERMLSEAISDADLPPLVEKKKETMDQVIAAAKSCTVQCNNVEKKLRQILDLTEDEAHFHMKQSAFLYHLCAQTMPKSHHCLSMRLTVEYFKSAPADVEQLQAHKIDNPNLRHFVIFSRNILAVSVTVNSTVMNSENTGEMVFHLFTDRQNFFAMKLWFARHSYMKATIHVQNIEDLNLKTSYILGMPQLSTSEEFRVSLHNFDHPSPMQINTEYVSVFGHSHFLLPQIFKNLKKVVVLDDDVVVQRDLSFLWSLDLGGKVNGAAEFCGVRLGQLKKYFAGRTHDASACAWMSGLNIVDLVKWREHNVTGTYELLLRKLQNGSEESRVAAELPISLLAFQDLIYPLDDSWVLSGLGHEYGVTADSMKSAAALHYNGNMKPWLDLGIPEYKKYWKKFLTKDERFMDDCNVNP